MAIPDIPSELLLLLCDELITSLLGEDIALVTGDTPTAFTLKDDPT